MMIVTLQQLEKINRDLQDNGGALCMRGVEVIDLKKHIIFVGAGIEVAYNAENVLNIEHREGDIWNK